MEDIVSSVRKVSDMIGEISASCTEQRDQAQSLSGRVAVFKVGAAHRILGRTAGLKENRRSALLGAMQARQRRVELPGTVPRSGDVRPLPTH